MRSAVPLLLALAAFAAAAPISSHNVQKRGTPSEIRERSALPIAVPPSGSPRDDRSLDSRSPLIGGPPSIDLTNDALAPRSAEEATSPGIGGPPRSPRSVEDVAAALIGGPPDFPSRSAEEFTSTGIGGPPNFKTRSPEKTTSDGIGGPPASIPRNTEKKTPGGIGGPPVLSVYEVPKVKL